MRCRGPECDRPAVYRTLGLCRSHAAQHYRGQRLAPFTRGRGTLNHDGYRRLSINGRRVMEHRYVMEQALGRRLFPHETVHHKNGDRSDNRPENLELWSSRHARGQRVEDLIEHAEWTLRTYAPERLR